MYIGEGNGNPLQCSCLENPGDGGAWWTAVYGVTQSRTRLKQLSSSMLCIYYESLILFLDFFFHFKKFAWSIVGLQCCNSFRCALKWFSYTYTYIHSFSDSFLLQAVTEYWVEFSVLYNTSLLVVCLTYSSVCMFITISQFIPLLHISPLVIMFVFNICKSVPVL